MCASARPSAVGHWRTSSAQHDSSLLYHDLSLGDRQDIEVYERSRSGVTVQVEADHCEANFIGGIVRGAAVVHDLCDCALTDEGRVLGVSNHTTDICLVA